VTIKKIQTKQMENRDFIGELIWYSI